MKNLFLSLLLIFCLSGVLCSCTATESGIGTGALAGGAIGGIIGHQSGETAAGAAIGAAGGAVVGGLIGHSQEEKSSHEGGQNIQLCPQGHEVDVTGYPPGSAVRCPKDYETFTVE